MSSGLWTLSSVHSKGCITGLRLLVALGNVGISKRRSRVGSCSGTLVVLVNKGVNFSTANLRTLNLLSVTSCHCLCLQVIVNVAQNTMGEEPVSAGEEGGGRTTFLAILFRSPILIR
jgi:hypothetical protein